MLGLAGLFFDPEDGEDIFFGKSGFATDYTALYPRKQDSS
jgi:hypothetical protein